VLAVAKRGEAIGRGVLKNVMVGMFGMCGTAQCKLIT
jgi:hypothetical protein